MKLALDLFTGSGSFEKEARSFGYEVISIDNRRRKGTCMPTLKMDLTECPGEFFSGMKVSCLWIGLPCDIWSNASGGYHLDQNFRPKTEKAVKHLLLLNNIMRIVDFLSRENPQLLWFIENPRGKLNKYPGLISWLQENGGVIHECTLSSYGFPTTKPTIIISNFSELQLKPMDGFGRGNKNKVPGTFENMTKVQRQTTPQKLIRDILRQIEKKRS